MAVYLFLTFNQEQVQICYCNNHLLDYFTCKSHLYICPPSAIKLSGVDMPHISHHHPLYADISTFCYKCILMDKTWHSVLNFLTTPFPPTWVDFPHPVSPATTTIWFCSSLSRIICLYWKIGRFSWSDRIFFSLLNCKICQSQNNYQTITVWHCEVCKYIL